MSVLPAVVVPQESKVSAASREDALRVLATPATRRMARELGVDLGKVLGSGKDGRVTKEDLEKERGKGYTINDLASSMPTPATIPATPIARALFPQVPAPRPMAPALPEPNKVKPENPLEERMALKGLRKTIAQNMVRSKFTAPHYTYVEEVDVTALTELRDRTKMLAEERGVKLSFLPFIVKASVAALKQFPLVNSSLDDVASEIILKKYYHIGIAVATDQGLGIIVIRNADKKSLLSIAKEIDELSKKVREGRASREEVTGSTFTVTSLGKLGGVMATPILNYPEVAILGVHKISKKAVVRNDQIVIGETMNVSLSFDHRVVDGAVGASFCAYMIKYLENPDLLLLEGV
jgi:pyruvate dehydrogenase E2 component (dihydrolipoamide acetyltransferase)